MLYFIVLYTMYCTRMVTLMDTRQYQYIYCTYIYVYLGIYFYYRKFSAKSITVIIRNIGRWYGSVRIFGSFGPDNLEATVSSILTDM